MDDVGKRGSNAGSASGRVAYDPKLSHFDVDVKRGAQGELFYDEICTLLGKKKAVELEIKTDAWAFCQRSRRVKFYIELECYYRDGVWRASGLSTTKAKFWVFVFGKHPGMLILSTEWLRRAVELAKQHRDNFKSCDYGENPTRGVIVYIENHVRDTRDESLDER